MHVKKAESNLLFFIKDINNANQLTVYAQPMISYLVNMQYQKAFEELMAQVAHYDTANHQVDDITGVRKIEGEYEVRIKWSKFGDENDKTWKPFDQTQDDVPDPLNDYLHISGHRNLKRSILGL